MSERNPVTYSKEMRERAKAEKIGLGCVDIITANGGRSVFWGPMSKEQQAVLVECMERVIKLCPPMPKDSPR